MSGYDVKREETFKYNNGCHAVIRLSERTVAENQTQRKVVGKVYEGEDNLLEEKVTSHVSEDSVFDTVTAMEQKLYEVSEMTKAERQFQNAVKAIRGERQLRE